jgi:hypothetical protein
MKPRRGALSIAAAIAAVVFFIVWCALLLMPVFDAPGSRRALLNQTRAQTDVLALETALVRYLQTFEQWPARATNHVDIIRFLRGHNDARRDFLDFPPGAVRRGQVPDPWTQPYHIRLDWEGGGAIALPSTNLPRRVAIWSSGPNQINEYGAGDDIRSW